MKEDCIVSNGTGKIFKKEIVLTNLENSIRIYKMQSKEKQLDIFLHPELIDYINEHEKTFKTSFLWRNFLLLNIKPDKSLYKHEFKIYSLKKKQFIN